MINEVQAEAFNELREQVDRLEAMVCAAIRESGAERLLEVSNWKAAGPRALELSIWWAKNQRTDLGR